MASFGEGDAGKDFIWIVGVVLVLGLFWIFSGGPANFKADKEPDKFINSTEKKETTTTSNSKSKSESSFFKKSLTINQDQKNLNESSYKNQITIKLGQSYRKTGISNREYLIVQASSRNKQSINISGWKIDNGYSQRYQEIGGKMVAGKSTIVTIPYGTVYLTAKSTDPLGPIILNPGDTAYVVTGSIVNSSPYKVSTSFKTNKCAGYLEKYKNYNFIPTLTGSCPSYDKELNSEALSDDCYSAVRRYGRSCQTPKLIDDEEKGILVDGRQLSSVCRKLVVATFNYNACFERHKLDEDFLGKKWYVYLKHSGLYAEDRATITLYDSLGKIVDTYSY